MRIALEKIFRCRVEQVAHLAEARVDGFDVIILARENGGREVLHEQRVQLRDRLGRAVVVLHELLAGAAGRARAVTQFTGNAVLVVEQQPVLAPAGRVVQANAQPLEESFAAGRFTRFTRSDETTAGQFSPILAQSANPRYPADDLQVAQPPGGLLDVWLEAVRAVLILGVPLLLFEPLCLVKSPPVVMFAGPSMELLEQRAAADDPARLQQRGSHGHVPVGLFHALLDGAHAMTDLEPQIPEPPDQVFQLGGERGIRPARKKNEDIDVRMRKEVAPAIASHGQQGKLCGHAQDPPCRADHRVDQAAMG